MNQTRFCNQQIHVILHIWSDPITEFRPGPGHVDSELCVWMKIIRLHEHIVDTAHRGHTAHKILRGRELTA